MVKYLLILLLLWTCSDCFSQRLSYSVSFPNLVHHEAIISLEVSGNLSNNPVFRMSRSSPGRYAMHEFGKNVYNVNAVDRSGKSLVINQLEGDVFQVPGQHDYIQISYTLYGNYGDGTYNDFDDDAVVMNMPATFMWLKGADKAPIDIHFNLPPNKQWSIATQLKPGSDSLSFSAPGLLPCRSMSLHVERLVVDLDQLGRATKCASCRDAACRLSAP